MKIKRDRFYLFSNNTVGRCIDDKLLTRIVENSICKMYVFAIFDLNKKTEHLDIFKENGLSCNNQLFSVLKEISPAAYKEITTIPEKPSGPTPK